jgi:hypothetical protein
MSIKDYISKLPGGEYNAYLNGELRDAGKYVDT